MADLSLDRVLRIVQSWCRLYAQHLSLRNPLRRKVRRSRGGALTEDKKSDPPTRGLKYMQIFDNNGDLVGCSNRHPHGQIRLISVLPSEPRKELQQMSKYRKEHAGKHMLEEYGQLESSLGDRVVWESAAFLAVCPWWAVWPYEILLFPRRRVASVLCLKESEQLQFAQAISIIPRMYNKLFGIVFPYVSALHQASLNVGAAELATCHMHMHFSPPLNGPAAKKTMGGYDMYAEPTRERSPEAAAAELRMARASLVNPSS